MNRVKKPIGILLLLSLLSVSSLFQVANFYGWGNDKYPENKEIHLHPSGFFNLTGSKIFIDDMNSSFNWDETVKNDWCSGEGSIDNPYVIRDVYLDGNGSDTCVEIRNSRVCFVIEYCTLSNAEIGIKIENCTDFKIIDNKISNLKGKDGLSGSESSLGINGENGNISIGILINDCLNVKITSNKLYNITGGNGGNGKNGTISIEKGGNGGHGACSYGILINRTNEVYITYNNLNNIFGGNGDNGGDGLMTSSIGTGGDPADGGKGGNGGLSIGLYIDNSTNIFTYRNELRVVAGGKGGAGGAGGFCLTLSGTIMGGGGSGGSGGKSIGIYFRNSININNILNVIFDTNGGKGNNGGSDRLFVYPTVMELKIGGIGGSGGKGGSSCGIYFSNSKAIANNWNQISKIKGGIGGSGGNGGFGLETPYNPAPMEGGNGSQGGLGSGVIFNNSIDIENNYNQIQEIEGGAGNFGGIGCVGFYYTYLGFQYFNGANGGNGGYGGMSTGLFFQNTQNFMNAGNEILKISSSNGGDGGNGGNTSSGYRGGNGGNGANGGSSIGIILKKSISSINTLNTISTINGGENGIGGLKGFGDVNGTDGVNGDKGIGYGFSLVNNNESLSYFNAIYCENNLDNGSNNRWNILLFGNYWAGYDGPDLDDDGIGDVPYLLNGSAESQDYLPLMYWPFEFPAFPTNQLQDLMIWIIIGIASIGTGVVISGFVISRKKKTRKKGYWLPKLKK